MKLRGKTALWLVASAFFFAAVSASTVNDCIADDNTMEVKADSTAEVSNVDSTAAAPNPSSVVDEVIWVVGDEPILLSDVENVRMQSELEGVKWDRNPDCAIPEQLAVQKLFLHQAAIDSIEVTESEVAQSVEEQINYWIQMTGSREKLEEYKNMSLSELRQTLHDDFRNRLLINREREELVSDITVSPADVRRYFSELPEDSLPIIPTEVEVQIITRTPKVAQEEVDRIKNQLREYTERVNKGETSFATLATLYSEDPGTARQGGAFQDYVGRGVLDPTFASVAFNLTDPKKISKIVETEYGFHIIQLIDKRGDRIKVRHILLRPKVTQEAIDFAASQLDSIAGNIREGKFSFDEAATFISDFPVTGDRFSLDASGASRFTGDVAADMVAIDLSGASTMECGSLICSRMDLSAGGASSARLSGKVSSCRISLSGASTMKGVPDVLPFSLELHDCSGSLSGASYASFRSDGSISCSLSGASTIVYMGNADISRSRVSGDGSVIELVDDRSDY